MNDWVVVILEHGIVKRVIGPMTEETARAAAAGWILMHGQGNASAYSIRIGAP